MAERDSDAGLAMPDRGYAICTSPRSGSNLLCQFLSSTGTLGHPLEYFNPIARRKLTHLDYPDDPHEQIRWILTKGATPNGIYGLKLFPEYIDQVGAILSWTGSLPNLTFVYLERRDLLGQAISWARAIHTEQYRSTQPSRSPAFYDAALIQERLTLIARQCARWSAFFARTGIEPVRLVYEEVVANPQAAVDSVAARVTPGRSAVIDPTQVDLVIQRNEQTAEWRARFVAERGDPDFIDLI